MFLYGQQMVPPSKSSHCQSECQLSEKLNPSGPVCCILKQISLIKFNEQFQCMIIKLQYNVLAAYWREDLRLEVDVAPNHRARFRLSYLNLNLNHLGDKTRSEPGTVIRGDFYLCLWTWLMLRDSVALSWPAEALQQR